MQQRDAEFLIQVREYINDNLQRPLSIAVICRQFGTSRTSLQDRFREYLGISLHAFLLQGRMERARALLVETDDPVKHIAGQCGYRKIHSFNKAFRNKYRRSPGQYRKESLAVKSYIIVVESDTL